MRIKATVLASVALAGSLALAFPAVSQAAALVTNFSATVPKIAVTLPPPPKTVPDASEVAYSSEVPDPLEPINRVVFGFNEVVDFVVLRPVNSVYRTVVPSPLRTGIANVVSNLSAPVVFANDVLQGEGLRARDTAARFVINTTVGVGGLVDVAAKNGIPRHSEDFGQTLGVWGVSSGPYLVLPVIGPSSLRDALALPVDGAMDPTTWLLMDEKAAVRFAPLTTQIIVYHDALKDDVDNMRRTSADFYATLRDVYSQRRQSEIANGDLMMEPLPPISGD